MNPFSGQIHNIHYKQYFDFKNSLKKTNKKTLHVQIKLQNDLEKNPFHIGEFIRKSKCFR